MPDIVRILQEPLAADAIACLVEVGTAQNFTLGAFMAAFQSSSCGLCKSSPNSETHAFAANICLLRCYRVCRLCLTQERQVFFLPLDMARECFNLRIPDRLYLAETAQAPVFEGCEWNADVTMKRWSYKTVKMISVDMAMRLTIIKHPGCSSEVQLIKNVVQDYFSSKDTPSVIAPPIRLAEGLEISGFAEAVQKTWEDKGLLIRNAKLALTTPLPYLHPKKFPVTIERGFQCEGCVRDEWADPSSSFWKDRHSRKAWLRGQVVDHFNGCESAQLIAAGGLLTILEEIKWLCSLRSVVHRYWPDTETSPQAIQDLLTLKPGQARETAHDLGCWSPESLQKIIEAGEEAVRRRKKIDEAAGNLVERGP